jgi:hypothetical protein
MSEVELLLLNVLNLGASFGPHKVYTYLNFNFLAEWHHGKVYLRHHNPLNHGRDIFKIGVFTKVMIRH